MHPGIAPREVTTTFHRPLQAYFKALAAAGLPVTDLEEWISHKKSDSGPRASAENIARNEIPMFLCIVATKL
jgi:DNA-binding LacI/PurR family transcriptional regulator